MQSQEGLSYYAYPLLLLSTMSASSSYYASCCSIVYIRFRVFSSKYLHLACKRCPKRPSIYHHPCPTPIHLIHPWDVGYNIGSCIQIEATIYILYMYIVYIQETKKITTHFTQAQKFTEMKTLKFKLKCERWRTVRMRCDCGCCCGLSWNAWETPLLLSKQIHWDEMTRTRTRQHVAACSKCVVCTVSILCEPVRCLIINECLYKMSNGWKMFLCVFFPHLPCSLMSIFLMPFGSISMMMLLRLHFYVSLRVWRFSPELFVFIISIFLPYFPPISLYCSGASDYYIIIF